MKIEKIKPSEKHYIVSEEDLELIKSKIIQTSKEHNQKCYKIRCIPKDSLYKVGERVICSQSPVINLIKVNDIIYMILKEYDILGKVIDG